MKSFRYKLILFFVLSLFIISCGINNDTMHDKKVIRIAYLPITHSIPVLLMSDMTKTSEDYYIELIRFTSWPEVVDALRTRRVDGASILFEVALTAKEAGNDLVMISLSHRDGNVIVVDNSISSFQDLKGKTLAIPHRLSPQNVLLNMVMEREGIPLNEINIIDLSPAEMPFTMASGAISAYIVAEPYGSVAEYAGAGRILESSHDIFPNSVCCVMVFHRELFNNDNKVQGWLQEQFNLAACAAELKDDKTVYIFRKNTSFNERVIKNSLLNISFDNLYLSKDEYEHITEIIMRYGVLKSVPEYKGFICMD